MPTLNFAAVKNGTTIHDVATKLLGLAVKTTSPDRYETTCPICKVARSMTINPKWLNKDGTLGRFKCWSPRCGNKNGDMIDLVSYARGIGAREAAETISQFFTVPIPPRAPAAVAASPVPLSKGFDAEKYLASLDPTHEALAGLGVAEETYREFAAGYCQKFNKGRLALAVRDAGGNVLGFVGRALGDEDPFFKFPKNLSAEMLFNVDRIQAGILYVVHDPIEVLRAYEGGETNVIASLAPLTPDMLYAVADFARDRNCFEIRFM